MQIHPTLHVYHTQAGINTSNLKSEQKLYEQLVLPGVFTFIWSFLRTSDYVVPGGDRGGVCVLVCGFWFTAFESNRRRMDIHTVYNISKVSDFTT